jgi:hypothetical protein
MELWPMKKLVARRREERFWAFSTKRWLLEAPSKATRSLYRQLLVGIAAAIERKTYHPLALLLSICIMITL